MRIINEDVWISRCLRELGEHSESEFQMIKFCLGLQSAGRYDLEVVDAGAYIGDLTVPLSRIAKRVYAFEPNEEVREILKYNLQINKCHNVEVLPYALGDTQGALKYKAVDTQLLTDAPGGTQFGDPSGDAVAEMVSLDSLNLSPAFIKADVEGMEIPLLAGAAETLRRTRATIFCERDTVINEQYLPLAEVYKRLGYDPFPMTFLMWSANNFRGATQNNFGATAGLMMLGIPSAPSRD